MITTYPSEPLGDLCEILDRKRKPIKKDNRIPGKYPYYGATGILDYVNSYIFDEELILIGEDGAKWGAGEETAFPVEGKIWVNNHAHVIRPNRKRVLDSWIIYQLNANDLSQYITGMTVPKLNQAKMKEILILLPPIIEQKRIISALDEAMEALFCLQQNAATQKAHVEEFRLSILHDVFAGNFKDIPKIKWNEQCLGEICDIYQPKIISKKEMNPDAPYPVFGANGVIGRYVKYNHEDPQLLIGCRGTCGAVNMSEPFSWITGNAMVVRPKFSNLSVRFLEYFFRGTANIDDVITGAAQPQITRESLSPLKIQYPSPEEQTHIVSVLDEIFSHMLQFEKEIDLYLNEISYLRQSLLQKAFAGELTK